MLVFTPSRHLAYVTSHADGMAHVLLFETFSMQVLALSELRAATSAVAG